MERKKIYGFLNRPGWQFGWKSVPGDDQYSFWHKHFAGHLIVDHMIKEGQQQPYDCDQELKEKAPIIHQLWRTLKQRELKGHVLVRCYANGQPYGCEGTIHTDSISHSSYTSVYYPHDKWQPNWGGETVFFNPERNDIVASIYPRPNRLVIFPGVIQHVARGVSRTCPALRITLMFKTECRDG